MTDRRVTAGQWEAAPDGATAGPPHEDRQRVLLLECRMDQMRSALDTARAEADRLRAQLAEAAAREAGHARRYSLVQEELAEARTEVLTLHRRLDRSDAIKSELEGHLMEAGARGDSQELDWLRREVLVAREKVLLKDRTLQELRARVEELLSSRDVLLARVAEWQRLVREEGPEAVDLAEFMAELRRDVLELERRQVLSDGREEALRERLARAGLDPENGDQILDPVAEGAAEVSAEEEEEGAGRENADADAPPRAAAPHDRLPAPAAEVAADRSPAPDEEPAATPVFALERRTTAERLASAIASGDGPGLRAELLVLLGRGADLEALEAVGRWHGAAEAPVRAAAWEALGRLLEHQPGVLAPLLRSGLADPDGRVRRRVALAAAGARGLPTRALLDPLRDDPDPKVRRVVREVLRHAPRPVAGLDGRPEAVLAAAASSRPAS